jgi:hypothetical protein
MKLFTTTIGADSKDVWNSTSLPVHAFMENAGTTLILHLPLHNKELHDLYRMHHTDMAWVVKSWSVQI